MAFSMMNAFAIVRACEVTVKSAAHQGPDAQPLIGSSPHLDFENRKKAPELQQKLPLRTVGAKLEKLRVLTREPAPKRTVLEL